MILKLLFVFLCAPYAGAGYISGFGSASVNYLDWNKATEAKSTKEDFIYLELEGGALYDWGDLYGFFDYENPGKEPGDVRTAGKGSVNYYLGKSGFTLYGHVYNFTAAGFSEQNRVYGLGYNLGGKGWWFKPFLGVHDVSQTFFSGMNGYMGGWVFGYYFEVFGEKWLLADWHEFEFDRHRNYAAGNGGRRTSLNGAVSLWWNGPGGVSAGVQWRYATYKLGTPGTLGAMIYTLKYYF